VRGGGAQLGRRAVTADFWAVVLVAGVAAASLLHFSRDTHWDESALYFFGIYACGVGCGWAARGETPHRLLAGIAALGRSSYALFLVHFPVCLLINALFQRFAPADPLANFAGVAVAWTASNLVALLFRRHVEMRVTPWLEKRLPRRRMAGQGG
jgi:peptidoglycan/LPS O-acetylase OafA/YrhL